MPKMKAYASFDLYLADQPPKNRTIIRALRRFVKSKAPELQESVKWGNGCWLKEDKAPVAYVYSDKGYVQFGFIRGSSLKDPKGQDEATIRRIIADIDTRVRELLVELVPDLDLPESVFADQ